MGKDITTTAILSTCAHCGKTVEYTGGFRYAWTDRFGFALHEDLTPHTVDLAHAFSHMTVEG